MNDALDRAAAIASELGDREGVQRVREIAEQQTRGDLNIVVLGQFKRGKSSLINALLRDDVMPTGALPVTNLLVAIRYGILASIRIEFADGSLKEITKEQLVDYVSESRNPQNARHVERVDIEWPTETIAGITIFDTPGIGSIHAGNTAVAHAALPKIDAAILVVGPEPPIGAEELAYARDVQSTCERLFIVLNKADLSPSTLTEVLQFTRAALEHDLGTSVHVDALSATNVRACQVQGREDPAFRDFTERLRMFVDADGEQTRQRSLRRRTLRVIDRLSVLLSMRTTALALSRTEREQRRVLVERALAAVDDRVRAMELIVDDDVQRLRLRLEVELDRLYDRDQPLFQAEATEVASIRKSLPRANRVRQIVATSAEMWRSSAVLLARDVLDGHGTKYARMLGEMESSVLAAGCRALSIELAVLEPEAVVFAPAQMTLIAFMEPTTSLEILIDFALGMLPWPIRRRVLEKRIAEILARELDGLRGKLRYGIAHDLEPWRRTARATISSTIASVRELVLGAFAELANDSEAPAQRARMDGMAAEVETLRTQLRAEVV